MKKTIDRSHRTTRPRSRSQNTNVRRAEAAPGAASVPGASAEPEGAKASIPGARYTIRFDSSVTRLGAAATKADQAHFDVCEAAAGVVLERVLLDRGFAVPDGDSPFRCETIAASLDHYKLDLDGWPVAAGPARGSESTAEPEPESDRLPEFPGFHPRSCFDGWVHEHVEPEDLVEVSTVFGTSQDRTYRRLTDGMTLIYGLPRFAARVRAGEFTRAHVDAVTYLCDTVAFRFLPALDAYLAVRRADVTCESLRSSLRKKINLLEPPVDRSDIAAQRRRVDVEGRKDGSACLILTGPADEIFAAHHRIEAMARAIHGKNSSTFNLPAGAEIIDERSISNLMYDLTIRPVPKIRIKVRTLDPITGIASTREAPLVDTEGDLVVDPDEINSVADYASKLVASADQSTGESGSAFFLGDPGTKNTDQGGAEYWISVNMPTSQSWLSRQAATVATVPFLTLTGHSDLPGVFPDGSPIPAEMARVIAGRSKTLLRILTDPATGTPIDAKATSYPIPNDVRKTLIEQWTICSAPGCSRRAANVEIDHVEPFFHLDPLKGGLTRFGNLQPTCKKHHSLKTAGKYTVRMPQSGLLEYEFTHGISTTVSPPDQPVNIAQASEFAALTDMPITRWRLPEKMVPPPPLVLELMPGESTIRQRDEERRRAEEREAKERALKAAYEQNLAARKALMVQRSLDWEHATFQPSLPPGPDPLARKQLTGNSWAAGRADRRNAFEARRAAEEERRRKFFADNRDLISHTRISRDPSAFVPSVDWDHDLDNDPPPF